MKQAMYLEEDLKGRMLRHIAALWGVKNTDALDPLIRLLIEAMAGELQKTYHEIHHFESRILEKIAVLMTPGLLSAPYCAHAIAQAQPTETQFIINRRNHFHYKRKTQNEKTGISDFYFTPLDNVNLVDGAVRYLVTGNRGFILDDALQKSIFLSGKSQITQQNTIWLGLKLNEGLKSIDNLHFYFDFKNTEKKAPLFSLLQSSVWEIGNQKLEIRRGIPYEKKNEEGEHFIFADYDPKLVIEKEIKHYYQEQFITIVDRKGEILLYANQCLYPTEFASLFSSAELSLFQEKSIWIKITTPTVIEEKKLFDLFACLNAFPVVNRKLKDVAHRFKGTTNVIPIKTDFFEYFLAVDSLKDSRNREYTQIPFSNQEMAETGTYSVRKSGTERIDSRSAKKYLDHLVELIRDESVAFSTYGQDTVSTLLKDADKILAQIEQRIKNTKESYSDSNHYVTLEFVDKQESLFLEYWVTNSRYANALHAGSRLLPHEGSDMKSKSVLLLTSTTGGKKPMDSSRHMDAYKYATLTHNRIVTVEDIKAFCQHELGDKIEQVEIRKGIMSSPNPKEGLVRCVDILLRKNQAEGALMEEREWDYLMQATKSKLELRSALNLHYQLIFA